MEAFTFGDLIVGIAVPIALGFFGWLVKQISDNSTVTKVCFEKLADNLQAMSQRVVKIESDQSHLTDEQIEMREMMQQHTREEYERQVRHLEQMTKITDLLIRATASLERLTNFIVERPILLPPPRNPDNNRPPRR